MQCIDGVGAGTQIFLKEELPKLTHWSNSASCQQGGLHLTRPSWLLTEETCKGIDRSSPTSTSTGTDL